ncbi:MAG: LytTR family DNA-binding domain-containing protein [Oscillospiraceae bacterium]|jgi:DNA-binding LytR/AlgR family response regulator|nr:LytTR family DNA-binding domain-containing protein [Oscillospiraceae bacterium]
MLQIAICDDEITDLKYIKETLERKLIETDISSELKIFNNAEELINSEVVFDVIFLDIDMPNLNGFETAKILNEKMSNCELVFVTNHEEFVFKAYKFKAIGYIRKRFFKEEIEDTIDSILQRVSQKNISIALDSGNKIQYINLSDVTYVQSDDHYIYIYFLNSNRILHRENISCFDEKYSGYGMIKIHNRYIVNYKFIQSIERNSVVLTNGTNLPISRKNINSVKEKMQFFSRRMQ